MRPQPQGPANVVRASLWTRRLADSLADSLAVAAESGAESRAEGGGGGGAGCGPSLHLAALIQLAHPHTGEPLCVFAAEPEDWIPGLDSKYSRV